MRPPQVVIVGASGDLSLRKLMPALASLAEKRRPAAGFSVVGVARGAKSDEAFRAEVRAAMPAELRAAFEELAPRVHYQGADVGDFSSVQRLGKRLGELAGGDDVGRLYYLSIKPELFAGAVAHLGACGLLAPGEHRQAFRRVVIEKPFGHDQKSAQALSRQVSETLREEQIYRIDHYLGKETVQNLLGLRFHNAIFEPLWNREHVDSVQITVAEELGMPRGRGAYYDGTGALRDVVQNHVLQLLALVAMEPPPSLEPETIRGNKVAVLSSLRQLSPRDVVRNVVRGQYTAGRVSGEAASAYRDEEGVADGSDTETFVAIRAKLDTWRWGGVPFLLRHGKRLPKRFTNIEIHFKRPPLQLFNRPEGMPEDEYWEKLRSGELCQIRPNTLTISIQPREGMTLSFGVKQPGSAMVMTPARLEFDYRDAFGESTAPAYERLLQDALVGDPTLFLREDEIAESWRFVDAIRAGWASPDGPPLLQYPAGTWGPETEHLFRDCAGSWSRG